MATVPHSKPKTGFLDRLIAMGKQNRPERIEIRIAPLAGAAGPHIDRHLLEAFENDPQTGAKTGTKIRTKIRARPLHETIGFTSTDPEPKTFTETILQARAALEQTKADLLIWGEAAATGTTMVLRFVSAVPAEFDQFGFFGLQTELHLPVDFDANLADLLLAISLAAISPKTDGKALTLNEALPAAIETAMGHLQNLPAGITSRERASVQLCFGNAIAGVAAQQNNHEFHQLAVSLYQNALTTLTAADHPFDWALTHLNLAACLQTIAERSDDLATLEAGINACEAALSVFNGSDQGMLWATAQNRLGILLYKMDLQAGDPEMLKKSLNAYQAALKVYSRTETPRLWADVMNNFAQAALVLGKQMHNPDVLKKAANACHSTLHIRNKNDTPMLWAATQNNLGSALFMLGEMTDDIATLQGAMDAFTQALGVYEDRNASRMVTVTKKNREHVKRLIEERGGLHILK